jgi:hypothetical protein
MGIADLVFVIGFAAVGEFHQVLFDGPIGELVGLRLCAEASECDHGRGLGLNEVEDDFGRTATVFALG